MKTLDRSRPYGEVWGGVGLTCYEQDGKQFMLDGSPLEAPEPAPVVEWGIVPDAPSSSPLSRDELMRAAEAQGIAFDRRWGEARLRHVIADHQSTATQSLAHEPEQTDKLQTMTDAELRTMVEIAGGTWSGRAAAIAFLADND